MIVFILVVVFIIGSLLMWSFVKVASDADKRLDELFQAFLLREENADGNLSEKIGQTIQTQII